MVFWTKKCILYFLLEFSGVSTAWGFKNLNLESKTFFPTIGKTCMEYCFAKTVCKLLQTEIFVPRFNRILSQLLQLNSTNIKIYVRVYKIQKPLKTCVSWHRVSERKFRNETNVHAPNFTKWKVLSIKPDNDNNVDSVEDRNSNRWRIVTCELMSTSPYL